MSSSDKPRSGGSAPLRLSDGGGLARIVVKIVVETVFFSVPVQGAPIRGGVLGRAGRGKGVAPILPGSALVADFPLQQEKTSCCFTPRPRSSVPRC